MQGCDVDTPKQNVIILHEFLKVRARRSLWRHFIQTTRSHLEPTRHSHVCSQNFISLDFVNDFESQKGYAKKRVISKTAVPAIFPSKLSDSQRSVDGLGGNVPVAALSLSDARGTDRVGALANECKTEDGVSPAKF